MQRRAVWAHVKANDLSTCWPEEGVALGSSLENMLFAFFSSKKGLLVKVKGEMRTGGSISLQNQIVQDYKENAGESLLWSCIVCKQQHVGGVNNM